METKVLMVCLGNICRSPLAEGILLSKVDPKKVFVDSAGTGGYHIGNAPDPRSIAVARKYGLNIENQRCRQFQKSDFKKFDVIYAMDRSNLNNILNLADTQEEAEKVKLLLTEVELPVIEVPDPYWDDNGFDKVFHLIDKACTSIAKKL
ncbi:low molecular weight protein-tyrosine-phosphatase [Zobellia galactanivorans]|uniref:low molecular weight protein-tyrosine-phosphatase n=1 Tax=Zobellia galactanivorans (strain DSM 12802 / CCUG 47099 / CIP 106680 / NCIMB 13871 / Dsij) TaxID=63186 RepID=UPI0026E483FF|nr:low molecular weight protein-tyrosine-phosphatase [Zobellia galactanivorans]MDO6807968.1 low molecular weight protein-tyrosine-phosphatase [Zobellia galactanivorans]